MRIGVVYSVPGIVRRTRKDGSIAVYWIAANCSRKAAGYPVKVVRLHGNRAEQLKLAYKLYGELQTWLAGEMLDDLPLRFDGTIASLIEHMSGMNLARIEQSNGIPATVTTLASKPCAKRLGHAP